jgi:hypothetical protein
VVGDGEKLGVVGDGEKLGVVGDGEKLGVVGDGEKLGVVGVGLKEAETPAHPALKAAWPSGYVRCLRNSRRNEQDDRPTSRRH